MGGYGSGGRNKIKNNIAVYDRIDSFYDLSITPKHIRLITVMAGIHEAGYYECPVCKRKARYLYEIERNQYVCRKCAGCNYSSQQISKEDLAVLRARMILRKLDVDTECMVPYEWMYFRPVKPLRMSYAQFGKLYCELIDQQYIWLMEQEKIYFKKG